MSESTRSMSTLRIVDIAYIGLFVAVMAVCSWISIPTTVPFTLQTFAIFLAVSLLGGKRGTFAVLIYVLLGAVGVPVFAGFSGGPGILFGLTGGYILGFIFLALVMWVFSRLFGSKTWVQLLSMILGLFICYAFGTAWFMLLSANGGKPYSLGVTLGFCVIPFIIPDLCKMVFAFLLSKRLKKVLPIQ